MIMAAGALHRVAVAQGLHAGYGPNVVLRDVSIEVQADRTSVIVGPGGSGKSTLLRLLSRPEEHPENLWIHGELIVMERRRSARMPQRLPLHDDPLRLRLEESDPHVDAQSAIETFWACAPEAGRLLIEALDTPFSELPHRTARLAAFTDTLSRPDRVFLLDEAEADIDAEARGWIQQKLGAMRGSRTILAVTHHLEFARAVADHVVLLVDGVVIESGDVDAFFSGPINERTRDFIRYGS